MTSCVASSDASASASPLNAEASAPVSLFVGQRFESFDELQHHLKLYESQNYVQFWCRDSRTVEAGQKRLSRPLSKRIKYYYITYRCIHGGKKFKSRGEGKRVSS